MHTCHGAILSVIDRTGREISRTPQETAAGAVHAALAASKEHGRAVIITLVFEQPPQIHAMNYMNGAFIQGQTYDLPGGPIA